MKNKLFSFIASVFLFLSALSVQAQVDAKWYADNQKAIDTLRKGDFLVRILDEQNNPIDATVSYSLVNHEFPWGTALALSTSGGDYWYEATARKFFNCGVPENVFKWSLMQPNASPVKYTDVDYYLNWCKNAGWNLRGHTLLWGSKNYNDFHPLMKWVKDLPILAMYDTCRVRVQREMAHYKGQITEYDVINEATPGHANYLQTVVGDSINWNAFKWARATDPNAKLYINDYNIITGAGDQYKYMNVIRKMLLNGAPVDGIGVQSHFGASVNPISVKYILDTLATLGLPIKVTEFDMEVGDRNISQAAQAKYYALMMRTAFAHPAVNGFMFWGFWDSRHWRKGAGLFADNKTPKIAADSVYNLIHNVWSSHGNQVVSASNPLVVNGYFGKYEIVIEYQGQKKVVDVQLLKKNKGQTVDIKFIDGVTPSPELIKAIALDESHVKLFFDKKMVTMLTTKNEFKFSTSSSSAISNVYQPESDSSQIVFELANKLTAKDVISVAYFPGLLESADGGKMKFLGTTIVQNLIPGFVSGFSNVAGDTVTLLFTKSLANLSPLDINSFILNADDKKLIITEIKLDENDRSVVKLILKDKVKYGQMISITYTPGNVISLENGVLPAFGPKIIINQIVTNLNASSLGDCEVLVRNIGNKKIELSNYSAEYLDYDYIICNSIGVNVLSGKLSKNEVKQIDFSNIHSKFLIIQFENMKKNKSKRIKLLID